jgi:hypothetical protein
MGTLGQWRSLDSNAAWQSLFALNAEYFFGDKGSLEAVDRFSLCPSDFSNRLRELLALPMRTQLDLKFATGQIQILWKETVHLTGNRYAPMFGLTSAGTRS